MPREIGPETLIGIFLAGFVATVVPIGVFIKGYLAGPGVYLCSNIWDNYVYLLTR